jgi:hypothetical protein
VNSDWNTRNPGRGHREQSRLRRHRVDNGKPTAAHQAVQRPQRDDVAPHRGPPLEREWRQSAVDAELAQQPCVGGVHHHREVVLRLQDPQVRCEEHTHRHLARDDHAGAPLHAARPQANMRAIPDEPVMPITISGHRFRAIQRQVLPHARTIGR